MHVLVCACMYSKTYQHFFFEACRCLRLIRVFFLEVGPLAGRVPAAGLRSLALQALRGKSFGIHHCVIEVLGFRVLGFRVWAFLFFGFRQGWPQCLSLETYSDRPAFSSSMRPGFLRCMALRSARVAQAAETCIVGTCVAVLSEVVLPSLRSFRPGLRPLMAGFLKRLPGAFGF